MHHATYLTRTALTTMGDTGTIEQVADVSPPREKLLAQLEWISSHRNGRMFDFIKSVLFHMHACAPGYLPTLVCSLTPPSVPAGGASKSLEVYVSACVCYLIAVHTIPCMHAVL